MLYYNIEMLNQRCDFSSTEMEAVPVAEEVLAVLSWEILAAEVLTIVPQILLGAWLFCRLLPLRCPSLFTVLYTASIFAAYLLLTRVVPSPVWLKPLVQLALSLALLCLFTSGSRLSAVCLNMIQCTLMVLMEILVVILTQWGTTETGVAYFYHVQVANLLMIRTGYNVVYGLMLVPVYLLWKKMCNSGMDYTAPELLPFLLGQMAMTLLACAMLLTDTGHAAALDLTTVAAVLLGLLAMGVVLYAYFGNQTWYLLERRRREAAHQTQLQRQRQAAPSEADALRRELRGRLDEVMACLGRQETEGVREQLLSVDQVLQSSRPVRFCDHPVADAVLWEQARRCEAAGIRLEVQAAIPVEVGLSGAAVCSLFSNVLDNAVHACLALPLQRRWIRCTAVCRGAYLILREENARDPAAPAHAGPSSGSGFGLAILSQLARRCDGSVEVQQEEERFQITVCLRRDLPEAGEGAVT